MAGSLADPASTADELLTQFAAALTSLGVTLPQRQYRAPGQVIVWDGEQMTVALMGVDQGQPGQTFGQSFVPAAANYHLVFSVNLVREIAGMTDLGTEGIPDAATMDSDGLATMGDAAALIKAAQQIHQTYMVTDPGMGFVVGPLQTLGPEGGLAACRLLLTMSAD